MCEISTFPQDSIVTTHHLNPSKYDFDPLYHKAENFRTNQKHISITRGGSRISSQGGAHLKKLRRAEGGAKICWGISCVNHFFSNFRGDARRVRPPLDPPLITPPSFMNFCPVVSEICRGHVHVARKERRIIIITLKATVIYKIYMQFNKNIQIYLIEIIIIHLNIMLCFQTHLVSCSLFWTHFRGAGKSPSRQDFYALQVLKKNRYMYMYQNKAVLHAFQIYNHLLTEVNVKTMIRDQTQEH